MKDDMAAGEWNRVLNLISQFDQYPEGQLEKRIDQLCQDGESPEVISYLRLNYALPTAPWELDTSQLIGGRYRILRKIGEGGMGIVYLATQERVNREVALKMIHLALANTEMVHRLAGEISMLGKMNHPNIVRVFDADVHQDKGSSNETLFFTMEFVEGKPLTDWVRESSPSLIDKLTCFEAICQAVAYAHGRDVVHRDLKPDNILIRESGSPAVLDFGLARLAQRAESKLLGPTDLALLNASGTPMYMSPERWHGEDSGPAGDLYALGVILYELFAGKRPWVADSETSLQDLRNRIIESETPSLRQAAPNIPRNLDLLTSQLLHRDPKQRPQQADEVAHRITLLRQHLERRIRWRRLAPLWIPLLILTAAGLFSIANEKWRDHLIEGSEQALTAAQASLTDPTQANRKSSAFALIPASSDRRHSEEAWKKLAIDALSHWEITPNSLPLRKDVNILGVAPDGKRFAGTNAQGIPVLLQEDKIIATFGAFPSPPKTIIVHPTRPDLVVTSSDGAAFIARSDSDFVPLTNRSINPQTITFNPDGSYLAMATNPSNASFNSRNGPLSEILVFETQDYQLHSSLKSEGQAIDDKNALPIYTRSVTGLAFCPSGDKLASWSGDHSSLLLIWNLLDQQIEQAAFHQAPVRAAAWCPGNPSVIATLRRDGLLSAWETATNQGRFRRVPATTAEVVAKLDPNPQGKLHWLPGNAGLGIIPQNQEELLVLPFGEPLSRIDLATSATTRVEWIPGLQQWCVLEGEQPKAYQFKQPTYFRISQLPKNSWRLAFDPTEQILATSHVDGFQFFDLQKRSLLAAHQIPLSGPIAFAPQSGDFWAYSKKKGPIQWSADCADKTWTYTPVTESNWGEVRGTLALTQETEQLIASKGTQVFINEHACPGISLHGRTQHLSVSKDGQWLSGMWRGQAALWHRDGDQWEEYPLPTGTTRAFFPAWCNDMILHSQNGFRTWEQRRLETSSDESAPFIPSDVCDASP